MKNITLETQLMRYIDAGIPLIYINTFEEDTVDTIIKTVDTQKEIYEWNESDGFIDLKTRTPQLGGEDWTSENLSNNLKIDNLPNHAIIVLKDFHTYLYDPKIVSKIKGIIKKINNGMDTTIIIVSNILVIPKEIEKFITILDIDYLNSQQIKQIIFQFIKDNHLKDIQENLIDKFSVAFKGLTEFEINSLLALSYASNGELNEKDLDLVFEQKQQMIKKAGILEMISSEETIDDIGGMDILKKWLIRKSKIFKNMEEAKQYGVDIPKGVLIAGIPGCGKSLSAKAAAKLFNVPLLRLDIGRLMGKYVGESEANLRNAIALAEAIAPCILWVDELEKAFAGIGESGGGADVTTRLFGNFLTWMQEKIKPVFVVATANDITKLPPELLRKGRFDELFYVDLPNESERKKIFEIHIKKRRPQDLTKIKFDELVTETEDFSGADIESVVKEAIETAFVSNKKSIQTENILNVIHTTTPISEIMNDTLNTIKEKYETRKLKNVSNSTPRIMGKFYRN